MSMSEVTLAVQFRSIGDGNLERAIQYCHDIEIERLVMPWASVPGYSESESLDAEALGTMRLGLEKGGITFGTMVMRPDISMITGAPEGERHWQNLAHSLEVMGEQGADTLIIFLTRDRPQDEALLPQAWDRLFSFYERFMAKAEACGIRVALHPVAETADRLKRDLVTNFETMTRLIETVPSPSNGVCMCLGNFWLSAGEAIYDQIRALGDRIYSVHVRATKQGLGETPFWLDTGGPFYPNIMRALDDVGYKGELVPEHLPEIVGENRHDAGTAWVVGYMKAMIEAHQAYYQ